LEALKFEIEKATQAIRMLGLRGELKCDETLIPHVERG